MAGEMTHWKFGGGNSIIMDDPIDHYDVVCNER